MIKLGENTPMFRGHKGNDVFDDMSPEMLAVLLPWGLGPRSTREDGAEASEQAQMACDSMVTALGETV